LDCLLPWEHALENSTKTINLDANYGANQAQPVHRGLGVGHGLTGPSPDLVQDHLILGQDQDQILLTAHIVGAKEGNNFDLISI